MTDAFDPCDFLEGPQSSPHPSFREAVQKKTTSVVRARRRSRLLMRAAALAACYLAGLGTMRLWTELRASAGVEASAAPVAAESPRPAVQLVKYEASAPELEKIASLVPSVQRAALYCHAGDRYWQEAGDVQSALRCYRLALAGGPEEGWAISVDDNWLLMALKQAKQKEKSDANADG